jgi:penicillin-binding protein 2
MKRSVPQLRLAFLGILMMLGLAAIVVRLWQVQIAQYPKYAKMVASGSRVKVRIPAVRGEIRDRNGIVLVENRMSVDVAFYLPEMVRAYRQQNGYLPLEDDTIRVHGMLRETKTANIEKIVREIIIPELEKYNLAEDYNSRKLKIHYKNNVEVPFNYLQDIDFEANAVFSERNLSLPGLRIEQKPVRKYVYGALGAHFLGYVGPPTNLDKLPDIKDFDFYDPDVEGKTQIELYMNDYLKGTPGVRILQRDVKGVIKQDDVKIVEPKQGANVYLTIDARIQYIAEKALRAVGRGAAVVIDPNNGDILAMASVPSYDPNTFIPSIAAKDWLELNKDETDPLLNRAISAYAPGSTYKIPISLAGMLAGIGDRSFNCAGGVTYGNKFMRCWIADKGGAHGTINLPTAIKVSCNAFFYQYGNTAGIDQIVAMGNLLGLGQKSGIPLSGEAPGVLPGPEWLAQINPNERWSSGYTANTSIGQGMVLATPLQMAMVTAAVANGGTVYYPRLIDKVLSQDGEVLLREPAKVRANLITDGGLKPEQIEKVRMGMKKVVNEAGGTAGKARIKNMEVAGKTGTAQFWRSGKKDNHTWFIAFAPYDKPKYAVCVIVQGAKSGGGVAAPIAAKILEDSFELDREPAPGQEKKPFELTALEPAKGSFAFIESVDFNRDIPAASRIDADEEQGSSDAVGTTQETRATARPSVREEADEAGRVKKQERKPSGIEKFFNNIFKGGKKKEDRKPSQPSGRR